MTRTIQLPRATSHTLEGPVVTYRGGKLVVQYDNEQDGNPSWTSVVFDGVLSAEFRSTAVCGHEEVLGFDYMVESDADPELELLIGRWKARVGDTGWTRGRVFRSYRMFFDDAVAIVVVAEGFEIESPSMTDGS